MLVGFRWVDGTGFGDAIETVHLCHAMLGAITIRLGSACDEPLLTALVRSDLSCRVMNEKAMPA